MSDDASQLVAQPFPMPSELIRASVTRLQVASESVLDEQQARMVERLPKPWEPGSCTGAVRADLWSWLDQVAGWINDQHLWAVDRPGVPDCWPQHPHLVHDLAVIASCRYSSMFAYSPGVLETWHRVVLPAFLDRLAIRMGGGCVTAGHSPTPRADRNDDYRAAATERERLFARDAELQPTAPWTQRRASDAGGVDDD